MRPTAGRVVVGVTVLGAAAALTGCGAPEQEAAAAAAAERFALTSASDPTTACALLAPQTRRELEDSTEQACRSVITQQDIPPDRHAVATQVAGHSAQVVLDHQTVFLGLFDSGWKVTAAGCRRSSADAATPYDCILKGG